MAQTENFVGTVEDMKKMTNDADKDREIWGYCAAVSVATGVVSRVEGGAAQTKEVQTLNCLGN